MTKKKDKICRICKFVINENEDEWVTVNQFKGKKRVSRGHYHLQCFREKFLQTSAISQNLKQTNEMLSKLKERLIA